MTFFCRVTNNDMRDQQNTDKYANLFIMNTKVEMGDNSINNEMHRGIFPSNIAIHDGQCLI